MSKPHRVLHQLTTLARTGVLERDPDAPPPCDGCIRMENRSKAVLKPMLWTIGSAPPLYVQSQFADLMRMFCVKYGGVFIVEINKLYVVLKPLKSNPFTEVATVVRMMPITIVPLIAQPVKWNGRKQTSEFRIEMPPTCTSFIIRSQYGMVCFTQVQWVKAGTTKDPPYCLVEVPAWWWNCIGDIPEHEVRYYEAEPDIVNVELLEPRVQLDTTPPGTIAPSLLQRDLGFSGFFTKVVKAPLDDPVLSFNSVVRDDSYLWLDAPLLVDEDEKGNKRPRMLD